MVQPVEGVKDTDVQLLLCQLFPPRADSCQLLSHNTPRTHTAAVM